MTEALESRKPQRVRKTPWTRRGCDTCKRRKKKCDEQKARCGACVRLKLGCFQPDIFCVSVHEPVTEPLEACNKPAQKKGVAAPSPVFLHFQPPETSPSKPARVLGSPHRPRVAESPATASPSPLIPPDRPDSPDDHESAQTSAQDRERGSSPNELGSCEQRVRSPWRNARPETAMTPTVIRGSSTENQLFQYYVERLIGSMSNADGAWNPLRKVVISHALSSQTLCDAVCACAAAHWARSSGISAITISQMAMGKYVKALSSMNTELRSGKLGRSFREDILLTSIFLCKYEIIKDGLSNGRPHLDGIISLYDQAVKCSEPSIPNDAVAFAKSFIIYHSCIASLTMGSAGFSHYKTLSLFDSSEDTIDVYTGYSEHLFVLLRRVMELLTLNVDSLDGGVLFLREVEEILSSLHDHSRRATFALKKIEESINPRTFDNLQHIAQAFKGIIYVCLHSVITEATTKAKTTADLFSFIPKIVPITQEAALQASIDAVRRVESDGHVEAALLPILFIIACEGTHEDMEMALTRVETFSDSIGMGNQRNAARLLQHVYAQRKRHVEMGWRGFITTSAYKELILT